MKIGTLTRTLSHLRWEQVAGQMRVRWRRRRENPATWRKMATPPFPGVRWAPAADWLAPGPGDNGREAILAGRLTFINETREVGFPPAWDGSPVPPSDGSPPNAPSTHAPSTHAPSTHAPPADVPPPSALWCYNLHYLEYLWPLPYEAGKTLVRDWIDNYPLEQGAVGWDPYPTSLRLMNLAACFFSRHDEACEQDTPFRDSLWASLFRQTTWLASHLETHLLGNHLLENGITLAFVGACFAGDAADRWRDQGVALLEGELPEQVLPDGMHFERSPMYQARLTYALAMLANTGEARIRQLVANPLRRMVRALEATAHPDGDVALFNDAALGVYHRPHELTRFVRQVLQIDSADHSQNPLAPASGRDWRVAPASGRAWQVAPASNRAWRVGNADSRRSGNGGGGNGGGGNGCSVSSTEAPEATGTRPAPISLPDAGYYVARNLNGDYLICDAGPLGPDYQPGHAHCDIFSFELSLAGRRVVVDGGTSGYQRSAMRDYCRCVRAHNTVQVGQADQAELWAAFRMGRRGRPRDVSHQVVSNDFTLDGWHDGYRHLHGRPVHHRRFTWHDVGTLLIRDAVTARRPVNVTSRLHLHPDCEVVEMDHRRVGVKCDDFTFWIWFDSDADDPLDVSVETRPYCPEFGKSCPAPVVTFRWRGTQTRCALAISRLADAAGFSISEGLYLRQAGRHLPFDLQEERTGCDTPSFSG